MDPQAMEQQFQARLQQELAQVREPMQAEINRLLQEGNNQAAQHTAEVGNLLHELDQLRNENGELVRQAQGAADEVMRLQEVNDNDGAQVTAVTQVKAAKPETFGGFRGVAPDAWLFSFEQYLELAGVRDPVKKITIAGTYLRGYAAKWYQATVQSARDHADRPFNGDWTLFKSKLVEIFKPVNASKIARDSLAALKQLTSVAKYNFEFTALCLEIPDISDADKLDRYVRGLKAPIRIEVELADIKTLPDAMAKAQRIDNISYHVRQVTQGGVKPKFGSINTNGGSSSIRSSNGYAPMELGALRGLDQRKYGDNSNIRAATYDSVELNAINRHNSKPATKAQLLSREEFARCMKNKLCLRCKRPGHLARNCTSHQQGKGKAQ
jgi:hypothetical protein